jgi:hypothetical protein
MSVPDRDWWLDTIVLAIIVVFVGVGIYGGMRMLVDG